MSDKKKMEDISRPVIPPGGKGAVFCPEAREVSPLVDGLGGGFPDNPTEEERLEFPFAWERGSRQWDHLPIPVKKR